MSIGKNCWNFLELLYVWRHSWNIYMFEDTPGTYICLKTLLEHIYVWTQKKKNVHILYGPGSSHYLVLGTALISLSSIKHSGWGHNCFNLFVISKVSWHLHWLYITKFMFMVWQLSDFYRISFLAIETVCRMGHVRVLSKVKVSKTSNSNF